MQASTCSLVRPIFGSELGSQLEHVKSTAHQREANGHRQKEL
jgi:hypothetical protein